MIAYLKGTVTEISEQAIVIEVGNIGYNVMCTSSVIEKIGGVGEAATIYTYTSVKEDAINLIGFSTREELSLFRQLITVSGIGPKGGLSLLSFYSPHDIKLAIIMQDAKKLAKAPGIGIKTAEHCVSDLKKKFSEEEVLLDIAEAEDMVTTSVDSKRTDMKEAVEALVALGYGEKEAKAAVKSAANEGKEGAEELLSAALNYF